MDSGADLAREGDGKAVGAAAQPGGPGGAVSGDRRPGGHRFPEDARSPGPARNSLRSLRSLWSDSRAESVHEAR